MKKKFLNLQLFGIDLKSPNTATYGKRMNETEAYAYYDTAMKDADYETEDPFSEYTDKVNLPKNNGKTWKRRKSGKYHAKINALLEGVVPEEDDPMETYWVANTIGSFGGFITHTDELDIFSLDSGESTRLARNQGKSRKEMFIKKKRKAMFSSRNHYWASSIDDSTGAIVPVVPTATDTLQALRDKAGHINLGDFGKIYNTLTRNNVQPRKDGYYHVLISPEVENDLMTLEKDSKRFTFTELAAMTQTNEKVYGREIGTFRRFKFFTVTNLYPEAKTTSGKAIHACYIIGTFEGENPIKEVGLEGYGEIETIIKDISAGDAKTNPLNQIGSIGWKRHGWGVFVDYDEALMVYECVSDDADEYDSEAVNKSRPNYVDGYDKNGDKITGEKAQITGNGGVKIAGTIVKVYASDGKKDAKPVGYYLVDAKATYANLSTTLQNDAEFKNTYGNVTLYTDKACTSTATGAIGDNNEVIVYFKPVITKTTAETAVVTKE